MNDQRCNVKIRFGSMTAECGRERGHAVNDPLHEGMVPGYTSIIRWFDTDRRCFTGLWEPCPITGCSLPAGHYGGHA